MYRVGLNYNHGTGHGIGAYGFIHESPIQVRKDLLISRNELWKSRKQQNNYIFNQYSIILYQPYYFAEFSG